MQFPARNAIFFISGLHWFSASEARVDGKVAPTDAVLSLAANGAAATRLLVGKSTVDGKGTGAPDHDDQGDGESENVVLKAFALLVAEPVCKKAVVPMDQGHGHHHVASDAESGSAAQKAENQADTSQKFRADGQEGQGRGDMHALSEKIHGGGKSKPAKPAEGLLRTVREEDHAKDKTKNGDGRVVRGVDEFAEHGHAPPSLRRENQD